MSRIGKLPVLIPQGVKAAVQGNRLSVEGQKGKLELKAHPRMKISIENNQIKVSRPSDSGRDKSLHGLTRTLVSNMVKGVSEEFSKALEIEGIGFKAELKGKTLQLALGFSHPVNYQIPEAVKIEVPKPTLIHVKGADKALVGQVAADIRAFFPPEPYKGKGIRYAGEQIRKKAGKAAG